MDGELTSTVNAPAIPPFAAAVIEVMPRAVDIWRAILAGEVTLF